MSNMNKYKIRKQAQTPTKVPLFDPATGKETGDYLMIRSSLSDEFTAAREEALQSIQSMVEPNKDKRKAAVAELQLELKAALVSGWSFDEPFTEENVVNFLREAPQIQAMVMSVADDSARFFGKPSAVSSDGPKKK